MKNKRLKNIYSDRFIFLFSCIIVSFSILSLLFYNKTIIRYMIFVIVIALLLIINLPFFTFAGNVRDSIPNYPVKGRVIDEKGIPLPGVTILLDSTSIGTVTGVDGTFSFTLPKTKGTLVFSFIG